MSRYNHSAEWRRLIKYEYLKQFIPVHCLSLLCSIHLKSKMANIEKYNDSDMTQIFQSSENMKILLFSYSAPDQKSDEFKAFN